MDNNLVEQKRTVSISHTSESPAKNKTTVINDGVLAKIVVFEKENLTDAEISEMLNIKSYVKMEIIKHFTRVYGESEDHHLYSVYNILI